MLWLYSLGLMLFSLSGVVIGIFLFLRPVLAIDLQTKFYEKINWRIKPVSLKREIVNTKIMGLVTCVISFTGLLYYMFFCLDCISRIYKYNSLPY